MSDNIAPFADGSTTKLRAGDTVCHLPSGEEWVVLCDTGTLIFWAGWPPGIALPRKDFRPMTKASDERHREMIAEIRAGNHLLREMVLRHNGAAAFK